MHDYEKRRPSLVHIREGAAVSLALLTGNFLYQLTIPGSWLSTQAFGRIPIEEIGRNLVVAVLVAILWVSALIWVLYGGSGRVDPDPDE